MTDSTQILPLWRDVWKLADAFWHRFRKKCVSTLQQSRKWTGTRRNVKEGEIVLISPVSLKRSLTSRVNVRRVRLQTKKKRELQGVSSLLIFKKST